MKQMTQFLSALLLLAAFAPCAGATTTLFLWKGETQYVWRDFTNATDRLVLVKPSSDAPSARVGVALPVRGDGDALVPDRVVWGACD